MFCLNHKKVNSAPQDSEAKAQQFRGITRECGEAFESNDLIWHIREGKIRSYRRPVEFVSDVGDGIWPRILAFIQI
jgi:ketosteroid isomerase-like protein